MLVVQHVKNNSSTFHQIPNSLYWMVYEIITSTMAAADSSTVSSAESSKDLKEEKPNTDSKQEGAEPAAEPALPLDSSEAAVDGPTYSAEHEAKAAIPAKESMLSEEERSDTDVSDPTTDTTTRSSPDSVSPAILQKILNDLNQNKETTRKEHQEELKRLTTRLSNLDSKLKKKLGMTGMATYTQAMKDGNDGANKLPTPIYVLTYQTQLCRAFHVHEVYLTEIKKMQRRNKKLILHLQHEIDALKKESAERELLLTEKVESTKHQVLVMQQALGIDPKNSPPKRPNRPSLFFGKGGETNLVKRITAIIPGFIGLGNNLFDISQH
jgi:hypothetical protein